MDDRRGADDAVGRIVRVDVAENCMDRSAIVGVDREHWKTDLHERCR